MASLTYQQRKDFVKLLKSKDLSESMVLQIKKIVSTRKQVPTKSMLGKKYGRLTVIALTDKKVNRKAFVKVRCECGNEKVVESTSVKRGLTRSCGCLLHEYLHRTKHNLCKHPLYTVWDNMKRKCYSPAFEKYKTVGAKGIKVCEEWVDDFQKFYDWAMSNGWQRKLFFVRRDKKKDFTPDNCTFNTHNGKPK